MIPQYQQNPYCLFGSTCFTVPPSFFKCFNKKLNNIQILLKLTVSFRSRQKKYFRGKNY